MNIHEYQEILKWSEINNLFNIRCKKNIFFKNDFIITHKTWVCDLINIKFSMHIKKNENIKSKNHIFKVLIH